MVTSAERELVESWGVGGNDSDEGDVQRRWMRGEG